MATVYKVEFELTSHWLSLPEDKIKRVLIVALHEMEKEDREQAGNRISISDLSVKKKV